MEKRYPIKFVSRRTGLTPHVIRVWERRYGAVSPIRTSTNRRLYSDADIVRLQLLHRATLGGVNIGQAAKLPIERILEIVTMDEAAALQPLRSTSSVKSSSQSHLDACIVAAERLDAEALETAITYATVSLSGPFMIEQVIIPLIHKIGDLCSEGSLRIAHEHLASALLRTHLGSMIVISEIPKSAPNLIVTTPAGQIHELGAVIVAVTAASEGWRVTYLGSNLPAEEIAGAAHETQAKAVALSIVYPADDPHLASELKKLRRLLLEEVVLLVGGRAADGYSEILNAIGAVKLNDIQSLRAQLESLRSLKPII